jgi:hypothetical protein
LNFVFYAERPSPTKPKLMSPPAASRPLSTANILASISREQVRELALEAGSIVHLLAELDQAMHELGRDER